MISASHNHFDDNGIKFFNHDGFKLSTEDEISIEMLVAQGVPLCPSSRVGRAKRLDDALGDILNCKSHISTRPAPRWSSFSC